MNLLQLVQAASGEMGLVSPTYVAGNPSSDTIQLMALTNAIGAELTQDYDWQSLVVEYRFTTLYSVANGTLATGSAVVTNIPSTAGLDTTYMVSGFGINQDTYIKSVDSASQVTLNQNASSSGTQNLTFGKTKYALPADWDRQIDRTHYDKSKRWAMIGPESAQQWQFLKSSYISTGPRLRYRIAGNFFQIWPIIATPEYLGFEYISKNWASDITGAGKPSLTVDTDTCIFPDRLMIAAIKLKYFEIKGFDTTALYRSYVGLRDTAKSKDKGSATLSFSPRVPEVLIGIDQIPDTGYGA